MFNFIKQAFLTLSSFSGPLASKCVFLNDELSLVKAILIDLNQNNLSNYQFMVSLDRFNGICNTLKDLSCRMCVLNETEVVNLNAITMIA